MKKCWFTSRLRVEALGEKRSGNRLVGGMQSGQALGEYIGPVLDRPARFKAEGG
ncbi:hypothetical protein [Desulfotalea psychrophila]|uniref:hypothetical protein n=1 Tax=Desulfotalea psychrophila TaxID=84980 RepID=UPI0012EA4FDC|nr:hypothetical protein [Desulfotalea psychrophila]